MILLGFKFKIADDKYQCDNLGALFLQGVIMKFIIETTACLLVMGSLQGCATSARAPSLPSNNYNYSATPSMDYMYRSPPPAVMGF